MKRLKSWRKQSASRRCVFLEAFSFLQEVPRRQQTRIGAPLKVYNEMNEFEGQSEIEFALYLLTDRTPCRIFAVVNVWSPGQFLAGDKEQCTGHLRLVSVTSVVRESTR